MKKLDPDTITTAQTERIFHALMTAAEKSRRIMRLAQDSDIAPTDAAHRLNQILANLNIELEAAQ